MIKALVAILTFIIGLSSVAILKFISTSQIAAPVPVVANRTNSEQVTLTEADTSVPFFDSFDKDDYFSCWLIADNFPGMREVWTILLDREDNERSSWTATVLTSNPDGSPNDKDIFESTVLTTDHDRLVFKTRKIRGVQYQFSGKFLRNGKDFADDEKAIAGTMRKIVKGKEVAKFTADFAYAEPVCFH